MGSLRHPTRCRVLFLSQAGTGIDHLHRENIRCHSIKWGPEEGAVLAGHLSGGRLLLGPQHFLAAHAAWTLQPDKETPVPPVTQEMPSISLGRTWRTVSRLYSKMRSFPRPQGKIHSLGIKTYGPAFSVTALNPLPHGEGQEGKWTFNRQVAVKQDVSSRNITLQARE